MTEDLLYKLTRFALAFAAAGFLGRSAPSTVIATVGVIAAIRAGKEDGVKRMKRRLTIELAGSALMLFVLIAAAVQ